jgi:hypothetical protein
LLQNQCQPAMKCDEKREGFVNHGDEITQSVNPFAKSCPKLMPNLEASKYCAGIKCLVQPDRENCCRSQICTCEHGTATVSGGSGASLCEADGQVDCQNCDAGYHLSAPAALGLQTCVANLCTCTHGTATIATGVGGNFCGENGQHDCHTCQTGHHLSADAGVGSQTCEPNVCTCPNGVATVALGNGPTTCNVDGNEDCSSCGAGYSLDAPAGPGLQRCEPNTCTIANLPSGPEYDTSQCQVGLKTGASCNVGCATGYTGEATVWTCPTSGVLAGQVPSCKATKCAEVEKSGKFTKFSTADGCANVSTGQSCTASCNTGYSGNKVTYECTKEGFQGAAMECHPDPCDASHSVDHGKLGQCNDHLPSGGSCQITCDEGYTRDGETTCLAGTLQSVASCKPNPCDASEAPAHGNAGTCTDHLASGASCLPTCTSGYTVSGPSTCSQGRLSPATCQPHLKCTLVYTKYCQSEFGYWSDDEGHLDYAGCEHFCNMMNTKDDVNVQGCSLAAVSSSTRSYKGKWCFAHTVPCVLMDDKENNAAADCVAFGES